METNYIIGQSGGPTSVINASLAGAFQAAASSGRGKVYGMVNGIEGFLQGKYVDLREQIKDERDLQILMRTPSSFLGSCRYRLPSINDTPFYDDLLKKLKALNIKYFFYIGGNDSMDTIDKLSKYGAQVGSDIIFVGIPKTIDNDLAVTDHSPGFGSAAKYIATTVKEAILDGKVYGGNQVTVIEIMGRNAGWLTAAAALAKTTHCPGPDIIWLPEVPFDKDYFLDLIRPKIGKPLVICLSEGIKTKDGRYVCEALARSSKKDAFGHTALGGTASVVGELIAEQFGSKIRPIELSTLQRCAAHIASKTDVEEAFRAGQEAVALAHQGKSGQVVIFERAAGDQYVITYRATAAENIANHEKKFPLEWIGKDQVSITDAVRAYMLPLIDGEMAAITEKGLPVHLYLKLK